MTELAPTLNLGPANRANPRLTLPHRHLRAHQWMWRVWVRGRVGQGSGLCGSGVGARLAERAEDFSWSSDRFYRRGRAPAWFNLDRGYCLIGGRPGSEARGYRELMGEEDSERYDEVRSLAQTFKGGEDFAAAAMRIVEVPELIRRSLSVEQIARAVAGDLKLALQSLRRPPAAPTPPAPVPLTAYLGKLYGRIPFARTAEFFNRSGASIARDVLHLDQSLRDSKELQQSRQPRTQAHQDRMRLMCDA